MIIFIYSYLYLCIYTFILNTKISTHARCSFMYVCMYACVYEYIYIYVSQGDFRLMSFTAGCCGTPLIPNDQLRRNGVRSSNLIVCVCHVHPDRKPIATNPDRRTSEASPPASDRKDFTNRTALIVRYGFDCVY